ncbi:MAG: hypothetical protein R3E64_04190 [Halioglobus sp.]
MNDLVIPKREPSPSHKYTRELARRLDERLPYVSIQASDIEVILSVALRQISRDIAAGRIVTLEHLGEFIKIDHYGPGIRYQADRRLLESCAIENLKQQGVNHG